MNNPFNVHNRHFNALSNTEHDHLLQILKHVQNLFDTLNIEYFFAFGTLLGAIRHGKRVPWDDDIDIVISAEDGKKLTSTLHRFAKFRKKRKYCIPGTEEFPR